MFPGLGVLSSVSQQSWANLLATLHIWRQNIYLQAGQVILQLKKMLSLNQSQLCCGLGLLLLEKQSLSS